MILNVNAPTHKRSYSQNDQIVSGSLKLWPFLCANIYRYIWRTSENSFDKHWTLKTNINMYIKNHL